MINRSSTVAIEEAPSAYKPIEEVIRAQLAAGLSPTLPNAAINTAARLPRRFSDRRRHFFDQRLLGSTRRGSAFYIFG